MTAAAEGALTLEQEILARPVEEREPTRRFFAENPPGEGAPIAIVIPAYNEEPTVAAVVRGIPREIGGKAVEVIVVVDGSDDRTADEARSAGALVCDVPINRGQGLIFMLGYWLAYKRGAEFIATTDADGQYDETEFDRVLEPILSGRADFVNGSRRLGTELTTDPVRHAGVIFFGTLVTVLVRQSITDPASGIRAFRTIVTRTVKLEQTQYQTSELLIATAMNGFRIVEVATTMRDRPEGATLTKKGPNLLYGMRFARAILLTFLREFKRKRLRTGAAGAPGNSSS
ncbi:MAG TPA: glycosyltransferase family 2 protein [Solirubrobacteraceae bacterium]|nr:glycosyltransferase family 2 protein [Solirubrobacteraceae bacterium]